MVKTLKLGTKTRIVDMDDVNHYVLRRDEDGLYYLWNDNARMDQWSERSVTVFIGRAAALESKRNIEGRNADTTLSLICTTAEAL